MVGITAKRRIWGWFFFDWASQPYNTLLLTFIFGPYFASQFTDGARAQEVWGWGIGAASLTIAVLAPILGAIADRSGGRMAFIWVFSVMYVVGAWGLWYSAPATFDPVTILVFFGIGLIGMEFATIFTNSLLPELGTKEEIGRISGSGWAFGYVGGVISLVLMLTLFAENATGRTLIGISPILGLDAAAREGTRAVGPFTAIWYAVFMIPFFLWVREPKKPGAVPIGRAVRVALPELRDTLRGLPRNPSLFAFLGASMFYRDALNGIYAFGGLYATKVLEWSVVQMGVFGILAAVTGAIFTWVGGKADSRFGPKPVIVVCVLVLIIVVISIVMVTRHAVFGIAVTPDSKLPDITFYVLGGLIGAVGGTIQSASRTMLVRQADPAKITESFGLYALSGKATSFLAPTAIAAVTGLTGSQQLGITPLIALFLIAGVLLVWVKPDGDRADTLWANPSTD
ncbi:MFS transporter [Acidimangrovimonas sediminis]|uniref:MFS transporter n=1 Tax=Acidimangrovimonas sediminis TaxID=2056283 RepID=UPI000C809AF6|nr:MFS transporter [Acidimangrovimonas sediminis]